MTLAQQLGAVCRAVQRQLRRRLAEGTDCGFLQLRALYVIEHEGVRTQAELAERLIIDAPSASRLVDRMEEDGLLKRCAGEDRRSVRLAVTPAARPKLAAMNAGLTRLEDDLRKYLTERELKTLQQLLGRLHDGMLGAAEDPGAS